jgi:hypothetical protein
MRGRNSKADSRFMFHFSRFTVLGNEPSTTQVVADRSPQEKGPCWTGYRISLCRIITMRFGSFGGIYTSGKKGDEFQFPRNLAAFRHNRVAASVADFYKHLRPSLRESILSPGIFYRRAATRCSGGMASFLP